MKVLRIPCTALSIWVGYFSAGLHFQTSASGQCQPSLIGAQPASLAGTLYGKGLAIEGGWVAAGAPEGAGGSSDPGYVTVLRIAPEGLVIESTITDPLADWRNYFGYDCALNGGRLAINAVAPYNVLIYEFIDGSWQFVTGMTPDIGSDGVCQDIDGDVVLLGAPSDDQKLTNAGAVYIFRRGFDGIWLQAPALFAPDPKKGAYFGSAVALSGNVALVGASYDSTAGESGGAAYLIRFDGVSWNFEQKLLPDSAGGWFGNSVALDGGLAVIGAWGEGGAGRAYIYQHDGTTWVREARLASDEEDTDSFGADVAVSDGVVVISDPHTNYLGKEDPFLLGASIYRKMGGVWVRQYRISEPDAGIGYRVAVDGTTAALGYWNVEDEQGVSAWDVSCCPPDCNGDGVLNINDFICFQSEWRKRSAYGDYNHDGVWNVNDFIAFQSDFRKGCP